MTTTDPLTALARAESTDPGNAFVNGCRTAFGRTGYLSAKQIGALERVTPSRRARPLDLATQRMTLVDGFVQPDDADDYVNGQSWDWAGGD